MKTKIIKSVSLWLVLLALLMAGAVRVEANDLHVITYNPFGISTSTYVPIEVVRRLNNVDGTFVEFGTGSVNIYTEAYGNDPYSVQNNLYSVQNIKIPCADNNSIVSLRPLQNSFERMI